MKKIGVVGAHGFVGKAICRSLLESDFIVSEITRENYSAKREEHYDILINTAMPSRRYWALNNPEKDFEETVSKTATLLYSWNYSKFVQISSMSSVLQLDAPYGVHKRAAEVLVENTDNTLIIRLGALYGRGLDKSALFDIINHNHFYVDINSEYNYIDVDIAASWIVQNLHQSGIKEVGAVDTISLREISRNIWDSPSYEGRTEKIYSTHIETGLPSSKKVLEYVDKLKENRGEV